MGPRVVSAAELAAATGEGGKDAWIAVDGMVLDVGKFLALHPGGEALLRGVLGTDATEEFELYHHDDVARKFFSRLSVGRVANYARDAGAVAVPFAQPLAFSRFNSPYYKETHVRFRRRCERFLHEELMPSLDSWALDKRPPAEVLLAMGREGFLALLTGAKPFPAQYLDAGTPVPEDVDAFHEFVLVDTLAQCGNAAVVHALTNGPSIALSAVMGFGTEELKARVAPDVLMGREVIALGMSEPNAGSDVAGLRCAATDRGDGTFAVNGVKKWITGSAYARFVVTAAVVEGKGTSLLLVDRLTMGGDDRLSVRKIGLAPRGSVMGTSYLEFTDALVPRANVIGELGAGFKMMMHNLNHERVYVASICNRLARTCVEESFRFAMKRKTFGKRLVDHDAIRVLLAKAASRVEQQHAWLESVIYQFCTMTKAEQNASLSDIICGLKAQGSEVFEECASAATHVFGGNSLDSSSAGRKIVDMLDSSKMYTVVAGSTLIMEMQMTKLALKNTRKAASAKL